MEWLCGTAEWWCVWGEPWEQRRSHNCCAPEAPERRDTARRTTASFCSATTKRILCLGILDAQRLQRVSDFHPTQIHLPLRKLRYPKISTCVDSCVVAPGSHEMEVASTVDLRDSGPDRSPCCCIPERRETRILVPSPYIYGVCSNIYMVFVSIVVLQVARCRSSEGGTVG